MMARGQKLEHERELEAAVEHALCAIKILHPLFGCVTTTLIMPSHYTVWKTKISSQKKSATSFESLRISE